MMFWRQETRERDLLVIVGDTKRMRASLRSAYGECSVDQHLEVRQ